VTGHVAITRAVAVALAAVAVTLFGLGAYVAGGIAHDGWAAARQAGELEHIRIDLPSDTMATYKRLTINMSDEVWADLTDLAAQQGIDMIELIKRAVALNKYCWEHRDAELLLKDGGRTRRIVMLGDAG